MTTVWGLVDDRTGHRGQVLGVIAKLGEPYMLRRMEYNPLSHLPTALLGATLWSLDAPSRERLEPPYPDLVIAAGRRMVPVLRALKKRSPATRMVYLMWPEVTQDIDLIAVPEHDGVAPGTNVITTLAPVHAVTADTLTAAKAVWKPQFAHLPRPHIGVCIGGDTKQGRYTAAHWRELISRARALAGKGSLLITTSRRTPVEALDLLAPLLQMPHLLYRWDTDKDNPYLGILACADGIIVTGDSLSMCAEACVSGKPVFVYASDAVAAPKHLRLHGALYARGMAKPLDDFATLDWQSTTPLDDAGYVATQIRTRFPEIFTPA